MSAIPRLRSAEDLGKLVRDRFHEQIPEKFTALLIPKMILIRLDFPTPLWWRVEYMVEKGEHALALPITKIRNLELKRQLSRSDNVIGLTTDNHRGWSGW